MISCESLPPKEDQICITSSYGRDFRWLWPERVMLKTPKEMLEKHPQCNFIHIGNHQLKRPISATPIERDIYGREGQDMSKFSTDHEQHTAVTPP